MSLYVPEICALCEDDSMQAQREMRAFAEQLYLARKAIFVVCATCADYVANAYNLKRYGEALTPGERGWPEFRYQPTPGPRRVKLSHTKRLRIFERDGYRCQACGSQSELQADHILPVSKGGGNEDENLRTLCRPCNNSRGNRENWTGRKAAQS